MKNCFYRIIKEKLGKFPVGAWVPYYKEGLTLSALERIRESGINFIPTITCSEEELSLIACAGLKALVNDDRITYANVTEIGNICSRVEEYADKEGVLGVFVWDEPTPTMMDVCGAINKQVQKNREDIFGYINLHPDYSDRQNQRDGLSYAEYLEYFVAQCSPRLISYDHYPFYSDGFHGREYFENLAAIRACCNKHGLDFWTFLQSTSFGENVIPSEAQLRFQANTCLAYGAKGLLYFTYTQVIHEDNFGHALENRFGEKTELYEYAKKINAKIEKIGTDLLDADHAGVRFFGEKYGEYSTVETDFSVSGGDFLAGIFSLGGKRYIYLVNLDFVREAEAEIVLGGESRRFRLSAGDGEWIGLWNGYTK